MTSCIIGFVFGLIFKILKNRPESMLLLLLDEIKKRSTRAVVRVLTTTIGRGDPTPSCEPTWAKSNKSEVARW